jgi:hypothetical protein
MAASHKVAGLAAAVGVLVVAGCGSSHVMNDQQRAQRIRASAFLPSTRVECVGAACRLTATTRLHSEKEAILIAWPLVFAAVNDPSLRPLRRVDLQLNDRESGARLSLACRRGRASRLPDGHASAAAMHKLCRWSWRGSY